MPLVYEMVKNSFRGFKWKLEFSAARRGSCFFLIALPNVALKSQNIRNSLHMSTLMGEMTDTAMKRIRQKPALVSISDV